MKWKLYGIVVTVQATHKLERTRQTRRCSPNILTFTYNDKEVGTLLALSTGEASHEVVTQVGWVLAGVTMEEMMESVVQEYGA